MIELYSPNMLKTYELCPKKFYLKYIENISMPVNDDIFEFGKNIHALASYYLKKENIDKMEKSLSHNEAEIWQYLKSCKYFSYDVINTEYSLSFKLNNVFCGGRLDALVKDKEYYYILDYKTGSAPKGAKYDYQTMVYLLATSIMFKTDNINFIYIDLKNKTEVKIEFNKDLKQEYIDRLNKIILEIKKNDFNKKSNECNCEYNIICY